MKLEDRDRREVAAGRCSGLAGPEQSGCNPPTVGDVGRYREAALGRNSEGLDATGAHLRPCAGRRINHNVDLSGNEVLHGRAGATIRDQRKPRPRDLLKEHTRDM